MPSVPGSPFARSCTIFCNGQVLTAVQSSHLYNDSKTFVDQPLITDPEEVLAAFEATFGGRDTPPTRQELSSFVSSFFLTAGSDTEPYVPTDYTPLPPQLAKISNSTLMDFALGLNDLWLQLGRRIVDDVRRYPQRYSLIWQPYPLVVPGGRFLESYYWDSYWIILGLLRTGMKETAMGVALNLVYLLDTFSFVPNGGRVYYALPGRSQPPFLSAMVRELFAATGNVTFLAQVYPSLLNEWNWWMRTGEYGHAVAIVSGPSNNATVFTLNRYVTSQLIPRPESWLEDVVTAKEAGFNETSPGAQILWSELAAGAETGWDYTSRWFSDGRNINTIDTSRVIPVELNAVLYGVEQDLSYFASILSQHAKDTCGSIDSGDAALAAIDGAAASAAACQMMRAHPVCTGGSSSGSNKNEADSDSSSPGQQLSAESPSSSSPDHGRGWAGVKPQGRSLFHEPISTTTMATSSGTNDQCLTSVSLSLAADAQFFKAAGAARKAAIEALLWIEEAGRWEDLRIIGSAQEVLEHQQQEEQHRLALHPTTAIHRSLKAVENGKDKKKDAAGSKAERKKSKKEKKETDTSSSSCFSSSGPMDAASDPNLHEAVKHYHASSASYHSQDPEAVLIFGVNVFPATHFTNISSTSSYLPLYTQAFDTANVTKVRAVLSSLQHASALVLPGGLTSTTAQTGQQWDATNGWAPIQHMIIKGLNATGVPEAATFARELARVWVLSNLESYRTSGFMPEKMNAAIIGAAGGGGEYTPQTGFGWSNAVVLDLICSYDFPHLEPASSSVSSSSSSSSSSSLPPSSSVSSAGIEGTKDVASTAESASSSSTLRAGPSSSQAAAGPAAMAGAALPSSSS